MADGTSSVELVWTWTSLLQVAFTTGLCTAIFNQVFAWVKETLQRRRKDRIDGLTLALQLVEQLTAYAQECNFRTTANGFDEQSGDYGRYSDMPALKQYPEGPWGLLPSDLAAGIRDLRNEVRDAVRDIDGALEVDGHREAVATATSRYGTVGYTSLLLANRLRRHYRLGTYQAAGVSTFEAELRKQYKASHPSSFRRLWKSLPVYKLRRRVSRLPSRALATFRSFLPKRRG
jgi:hypothetical protein